MMKGAPRFWMLIVFIGFGLCFSQKAQGNHLMGADIQWECVGKDSFEVSLSVYRDCKGSAPSDLMLDYSCQPADTQMVNYTVNEITPACESACTQCDSSNCSLNYGIREHRVTWLTDFSGTGCSQITFSYQDTGRYPVTTGPSGDLYIEAWMDLNKAPCNNSLQLEAAPQSIFCKDDSVFLSQGAYTDEDSIVVEWTQPLNEGDSAVSWNSGYNYDNPLTWQGKNTGLPRTTAMPYGLHLDTPTGDLAFTPVQAGQTSFMAFQFNEYRDGELIAYTKRDMFVSVEACPDNQTPNVSGINCNPDQYKEICAGRSLTFCGTDPDDHDTVILNFNNGNLPDGIFWSDNNGETSHPTGTLTFPEDIVDSGAKMYSFSIKARDNHCPLNASNSKTYKVKVENCTGTPVPSKVRELTVYPNPNKGPFTIEFKAHSGKSVTTRVYDMNGKLVHENKLKGDNSVFSERINLNGQSEGIYHLEIKTGAEVIHKQIVIQE